LGERRLDKAEVAGSSPAVPIQVRGLRPGHPHLGEADAVSGGIAEAGVDAVGALLRGFGEFDAAPLQLLVGRLAIVCGEEDRAGQSRLAGLVIGTYTAVLAISLAALAIGQAAIALCGVRRWSWPAPAVGLALLCAVCWGTVRLGGDGVVSAVVVSVLGLASLAYLWGRLEDGGEALRQGVPVAVLALLATALPFVAEGHFGILGTSFNPDMSQHLLATDRLAHGESSQLLRQGYPLGPHAIVAALNHGLGISLVQGFTGLMVAVAVLASLTALTAFRDQPAALRIPAALVVGLTYMVASYYAQGSFKETMQALFFLAFVLALRESSRNPDWRDLPLRFVPAALLAVGSVYTYSFPGLIWLIGAAAIFLAIEVAQARFRSSAGGVDAGGPRTEAQPPPAGPPAVATGPARRNALSHTAEPIGDDILIAARFKEW
jgi:hypothetical protein